MNKAMCITQAITINHIKHIYIYKVFLKCIGKCFFKDVMSSGTLYWCSPGKEKKNKSIYLWNMCLSVFKCLKRTIYFFQENRFDPKVTALIR